MAIFDRKSRPKIWQWRHMKTCAETFCIFRRDLNINLMQNRFVYIFNCWNVQRFFGAFWNEPKNLEFRPVKELSSLLENWDFWASQKNRRLTVNASRAHLKSPNNFCYRTWSIKSQNKHWLLRFINQWRMLCLYICMTLSIYLCICI